jgi:nicotinate-nucleotide pyrophosphorylase (carboxylating)
MSSLNNAELAACDRLIELALAEDLGDVGDRTSQCLIPADQPGRAAFVVRTPGVLAGLPVAERVLRKIDPTVTFEALVPDGTPSTRGTVLATVSGPLRSILTAERTALNFLQRLSGVATLTRKYVDAVAGITVQVLDTRKTTPGWRRLEKYAVRMGGGTNHRMGLYDGVLIKDNHLAGLGATAIPRAIELARSASPGLPIEVEVDTLEQLEEALASKPDIVLLDNMTNEQMRSAVERRNAVSPATRLEASGGVNLTTIRGIAETGVDRISIGALTHSAVALDIALDYLA